MSDTTPIFVMGCARSGTTLLASVIGNSPVTADYRAETLLLHGCEARYGSLSDSAAKSRFELDWLKSRQFRRSGLEKETARELILRSRSYAEFLGAYMGEIAKRQAKTHWIDSTPSNVFELKAIAENFPTAKVINIVRDGRAVAASLRKLGWTVFNTGSPWSALQYAALKWESAVKQFSRGRELFPGGVFETTYEALIGAPGELLPALWHFLEFDPATCPTNTQDEQETAAVRVTSNSAFGQLGSGISKEPLTRWRKQLSEREIDAVERVVGKTLVENGYGLLCANDNMRYPEMPGKLRRGIFETRNWIKASLPLRALYSSPLEIGAD